MSENQIEYTKDWYIRQIRVLGKSLPQIASERGTTVVTLRKEIRNLYVRPACANKLIGQAAANEAAKRNLVNAPVSKKPVAKPAKKEGATPKKNLPYAVQLAQRLGTALIDSNYAANRWDYCKLIENPVVPEFCINELTSMATHKEDPKERAELERKIRYLKKHAEVIKADRLPVLALSDEHKDFGPRNITFARYVQYMWQVHGFKVPYLTCAYEAGVLIKKYVKLDNPQA